MSTEVRAPFQFFTDTDGNALESGYIYIGVEHLNPLASPLQAYWDSSLTIPAYNVRTVSGYPAYGGSPGRLYVSGNYSILVKNRNLETVFMSLSMEGILSYSDINLLSIKNSIEYGTQMFDILPNMEYRTPTEWDPLNPGNYFPRLCLTDFSTYKDISTTNWPIDAINRLRNIKIVFKQGLTGEISSPVVTNWAIAANVATLTFQNDADHISYFTDLLEDETQHGSYNNYRSVTLPLAIGDIAAGTYALTNINAASRTVSFAFVAANNSGALAAIVDFYAYVIPGSTTTARVFSAKGLSIMGVNDAYGYFVSGGIRRRGYMQTITGTFDFGRAGDGVYGIGVASTGALTGQNPLMNGFTASGVPANTNSRLSLNSSLSTGARAGNETHSPSLSAHLYLHLGGYTA